MLGRSFNRSTVAYNRNLKLSLQTHSLKRYGSYRGLKPNSNITSTFNNTLKYHHQCQRISTVNLTFIIPIRQCSSSSFSNFIHKIFLVKAEELASPDENIASTSVEYIPPPPVPPDFVEESLVEPVLNSLGEPTFQSLGLGGWSPVGFFQNAIEFFHVSLDLPWWAAISLITVIIRLCVFPLIITSQRNMARLNNCMPTVQRFQAKMDEARLTGNQLEYAKISYELHNYMKANKVSPLKNAMVPFAQAPIFISMFIGLRRCSNLPVESFKDGGMLWFTDLTVADPMYGLPLMTCVTLFATLKMGADGQQLQNQKSVLMKYVLMGLPVVCLPFMINFPSAILCYWASSNIFSLVQVSFLRIPVVRKYFNIDVMKKQESQNPKDKKGVIQNIKDTFADSKLISRIEERRRVDEIKFKRAGTGPLVKTFKHNPLKTKGNVIDVQGKVKGQ